MSANIVQSILDENKENLTDELYLKLSNSLLTIHHTSEEELGFYEATIVVPKFSPAKGGTVRYESVLRTVITRIEKNVADTYIQYLQESGSVYLCMSMFNNVIDHQYEIYDTDTDILTDENEYEFNMIRCDMNSVLCIKLSKL